MRVVVRVSDCVGEALCVVLAVGCGVRALRLSDEVSLLPLRVRGLRVLLVASVPVKVAASVAVAVSRNDGVTDAVGVG
jgi:hypothetical protein